MSKLIDFFANMDRIISEKPGKTAFRMGDGPEALTYSELDEYSGKVYGYLKKHGIGKEDIVLIMLPRSIQVFAAMLGVWKAGAAFVIVENTAAPERMNYIRQDCECKCFLNEEILRESLAGDPLPGRETVGRHDLAYVIYTSGSTGNPKGVLHEYGNIDKITPNKRCDGEYLISEDSIVAYNSSLSFVAAVHETVDTLNHGATFVLVPTETVRNIQALITLYEHTGVTMTFMTPSLYRTCKNFNSQLQTIMISAEPCSGIENDRFRMVNAYSSSEAGRILCSYRIVHACDKTPVGKNQSGEEIQLLDEDGHPVREGETGEICYKNEYMRGYHHLPEKTREAFRGGLFHTGDLAFRDTDGNITILGRKDDMIKINGNRVEPGETASVVKEILGLSWCAARGFVSETGRAYLCVYYLRGCVFDENELREKLRKKLPEYMIPAFFVAIDEIPLLPTGKLNKRALPEPAVHSVAGSYTPPENEQEARIIAEMDKALGVRQIGRDDSFRRLGGDSVAAMIIASDLADLIPGTSFVLEYDTPAEIAKASLLAMKEENGNIRPAELSESYEITTGAYFFYPGPYDPALVCSEIRLTREINGERLQKAVDALLKEIPFLSLTLQKAPDDSRYLLVPGAQPFRVVRRNDHVPVFSEEARGYLFTVSYDTDTIRLMVHHGLTDGMGVKAAMTRLLYHYLSLTGDAAPAEKGTRGTYSYADPDTFIKKLPTPGHVFPYSCPVSLAFSNSELDPELQKESMISFSMSRALDIARGSEGSVQAILMIALGEAILRASGGKKKQVTVSCPMDLRSRLGCPDTLRNCTISYKFNISERLLALKYRDRLTAVKGMQYLQDDSDFWLPRCLSSLKYEQLLNSCPTIQAKNDLLTSHSSSEKAGYPVVSFLGDLGLDPISGQIRAIHCTTNLTGNAGIILFAWLVHERCYVSICTNVIDDTWKTCFIDNLKEAGLDVNEVMPYGKTV